MKRFEAAQGPRKPCCQSIWGSLAAFFVISSLFSLLSSLFSLLSTFRNLKFVGPTAHGRVRSPVTPWGHRRNAENRAGGHFLSILLSINLSILGVFFFLISSLFSRCFSTRESAIPAAAQLRHRWRATLPHPKTTLRSSSRRGFFLWKCFRL